MPNLKTELNIYLSLTGEEAKTTKEAIDVLGVTYREIFLAGINTLYKEVPEKVKQKAKDIIK